MPVDEFTSTIKKCKLAGLHVLFDVTGRRLQIISQVLILVSNHIIQLKSTDLRLVSTVDTLADPTSTIEVESDKPVSNTYTLQ